MILLEPVRAVEELFSHLDADGDGAIDEEDRVAGCHARRPTVVEFSTKIGVQEFVSFFATVDKVGQLKNHFRASGYLVKE